MVPWFARDLKGTDQKELSHCHEGANEDAPTQLFMERPVSHSRRDGPRSRTMNKGLDALDSARGNKQSNESTSERMESLR